MKRFQKRTLHAPRPAISLEIHSARCYVPNIPLQCFPLVKRSATPHELRAKNLTTEQSGDFSSHFTDSKGGSHGRDINADPKFVFISRPYERRMGAIPVRFACVFSRITVVLTSVVLAAYASQLPLWTSVSLFAVLGFAVYGSRNVRVRQRKSGKI